MELICEFCNETIRCPKKNQLRHQGCSKKYYSFYNYLVNIKKISKKEAIERINYEDYRNKKIREFKVWRIKKCQEK